MKNQRGQILVAVLLAMLTGLTVGLSLISRTTQDVAISSRSEDSAQAFAAAEGAVEQALNGVIAAPGQTGTLAPGIAYDIKVIPLGGTAVYPQNPVLTDRGEVMTIWLANHDASGALIETPTYTAPTIDICWSGASVTPALLVTYVYKKAGAYRFAYGAYDPDSARASGTNFDSQAISSGGGNCGSLTYKKTITFANIPTGSGGGGPGGGPGSIDPAVDTLIALRVIPLYSSARIAVSGASGVNLAAQGLEIVSRGIVGTTNRQVRVVQSYKEAPKLFDLPAFSTTGSLIKN